MANDRITYKLVHGNTDKVILQKILAAYSLIFEDSDSSFFKGRFDEHPQITSVLAFNKDELIGFKIGYPYDNITFYSWVGGVLPNYRQQGIANELAEQQELAAKSQGFKKLRTKSMNQFKPMIILNLKRGFDINEVYTNVKGQTKIIFEKKLK